jgi:hypothetical protein
MYQVEKGSSKVIIVQLIRISIKGIKTVGSLLLFFAEFNDDNPKRSIFC